MGMVKDLTREQSFIINEIISTIRSYGYGSYRSPDDVFLRTVGGYAGTGKTTLLCELRNQIKKEFPKLNVAFLTPTGKAASVLNKKLKDSGSIYTEDYIGTIHGLIYKPKTVYDPILKTHIIVRWVKKSYHDLGYDILIVDEASMISKQLFDDLTYFQSSIIFAGDYGQLPPIDDNFNLLSKLDFKLTEIHRQAFNSPIIALSKFIREEGYIPANRFFSDSVFKLPWESDITQKIWNESVCFDDDLIILCAFNTTRANMNDKIRTKLGFEGTLPIPGEKIVCLQNNHTIKIMNGQVGILMWIMPMGDDLYRMTVEIDGDMFESLVSTKCFGQVVYTMYNNIQQSKQLKRQLDLAQREGFGKVDYFDHGYCISVHKSQGSEWQKVVLFEQRTKRWDDEYYMRWLYTAVTRAKEKLFIISDYWG